MDSWPRRARPEAARPVGAGADQAGVGFVPWSPAGGAVPHRLDRREDAVRGQGLTIARSLAEQNGAPLTLRNHLDGGLEAVLRFSAAGSRAGSEPFRPQAGRGEKPL